MTMEQRCALIASTGKPHIFRLYNHGVGCIIWTRLGSTKRGASPLNSAALDWLRVQNHPTIRAWFNSDHNIGNVS